MCRRRLPCRAVLEFPQLRTLYLLDPILIELAPSILAADFAHLADQVERATAGGGSVLHVDIMDGHFVPNLTIGPPVVKSLRQATRLPLDCHLMIENPDQYIADFAEAGADWISVHQETCRHLNRTLHLIKQHECRAGVVINPATPVETLSEVLDIVDYVLVMSVNPGFGAQKFIPGTLHKMKTLAEIRAARGYEFRIEVDGGVGNGDGGGSGARRCGDSGGGECGVRQGRCQGECAGAARSGAEREFAESLKSLLASGY
jgi:ribulose-phosphate 3-epimerase